MKTTKVILLGNGINRALNPYSWEDLIDDLIAVSRFSKTLDIHNKPFPLLYEEIYLNEARKSRIKEIEITEFRYLT